MPFGGSKPALLRLQKALGAAIFAMWLLPQVWLLFQGWKLGGPLSTIAYILCISTSVLAMFLPAGYFRPRPFELSGRLYEKLGIRFFKRFMLHGDYLNRHMRRFEPNYRIISTRDSMRRFEAQTRANEAGHLMWLMVTAPSIVYAAILGCGNLAVFLFFSNVIINVYPMLLQRYTRARIHRVLTATRSKTAQQR